MQRNTTQNRYQGAGCSRSLAVSSPSSYPSSFCFQSAVRLSNSDSWNQYSYNLVQPVLAYQNYQATCLLSGGTVIYDSSFASEPIANSYQTFVSAGADGNSLAISAVFQSNNITACTLQLYFQVSLSVVLELLRIEYRLLLYSLFSFTGPLPTTNYSSHPYRNGALLKHHFSLPFPRAQWFRGKANCII